MDYLSLNFDILAFELRRFVSFLNTCEDTVSDINIFRVYDLEVPALESGCAYVCTPETYPDISLLHEGISIICCGKPDQSITYGNICYELLVLQNITLNKTINALVEIFNRYKGHSAEIGQIVLRHESISDLIESLSKFTGLPLSLLNINQEIVAFSKHVAPKSNLLWSAMSTNDSKTMKNILTKQIEDIINAPSKSKDFSAHEITVLDEPTLVATLFIDWHATAFLWAFLTDRAQMQFTKAQRHLFGWASEVIVTWMKESESVQAGQGTAIERLVFALIKNDFESRSHILVEAKEIDFPLDISRRCQLITLLPSRPNALRFSKQIKMLSDLDGILPNSVSALYERYFVSLIEPSEFGNLNNDAQKGLSGFCTINRCFALIGNVYNHIEDTYKVFEQLTSTFTFIDTTSTKYGVYNYYDFAPSQENLLIANHQPLETSFHPMIIKLISYDEKHGSDYLYTLKVYLNNMCNLSDASNELGMHRNSLIYRINKIEKILDSDFKSWKLRRLLLRSIDNFYFYLTLKENPFNIKI